ncbi:hypothetical protein JZ751_028572 [Albula glossodonta]|uniref:Uncharacterized protein n=1 Tax=Albula glossodonta TaxID=121402 RepID=A0A8T2NB35_9TELE|nr:hypothetical protein JZ751_028572 [Albula glossodonta]
MGVGGAVLTHGTSSHFKSFQRILRPTYPSSEPFLSVDVAMGIVTVPRFRGRRYCADARWRDTGLGWNSMPAYLCAARVIPVERGCPAAACQLQNPPLERCSIPGTRYHSAGVEAGGGGGGWSQRSSSLYFTFMLEMSEEVSRKRRAIETFALRNNEKPW